MTDIPVVYTLTVCPACDHLRSTWRKQGIKYEEKRVDQSQETLDEALLYGDSVPIILYPDGRVEIGFEGRHGLDIGCWAGGPSPANQGVAEDHTGCPMVTSDSNIEGGKSWPGKLVL